MAQPDVPNPGARASSKVRRLAVLVVLVATALMLVVAGVAGEFALRYRERHRDTVPGTMPLLFYRHNRTGHALVRNADYFGWVHTNSAGFRGTREYPVAKRAGVLRIMILGSSTTFDQFVTPDSLAWPARLEQHLRSHIATDVEVINAGTPGHVLLDDLWRLQAELYAYDPDLLVVYEGHNDLFRAIRRSAQVESAPANGDTPDEVVTVTPWGGWLSRHSMLYAKVIGRWDAIRFRSRGRAVSAQRDGDGERPAHEALDRGAEKFARDLSAVLAMARSLGLRVVVPQLVHVSGAGAISEPDAAIGHLWNLAVPFGTPNQVLGGYVLYDSVARVVAPQYGAIHLPTDAFGLSGEKWYTSDDPIHFNPAGAERMAMEMARALVSTGLAGKPAN